MWQTEKGNTIIRGNMVLNHISKFFMFVVSSDLLKLATNKIAPFNLALLCKQAIMGNCGAKTQHDQFLESLKCSHS